MKKILIALTVLIAINQTAHSSVYVDARAYTHSCAYYSSAVADLQIFLDNDVVPANSRVFLRYGFEGYNADGTTYVWNSIKEIEIFLIGSKFWMTEIEMILNQRGHAVWRRALNFVFRIETKGGAELWINGSSSMGYFRVGDFHTACLRGDKNLLKYHEAPVQIIRK
jgi:hypothetical protein